MRGVNLLGPLKLPKQVVHTSACVPSPHTRKMQIWCFVGFGTVDTPATGAHKCFYPRWRAGCGLADFAVGCTVETMAEWKHGCFILLPPSEHYSRRSLNQFLSRGINAGNMLRNNKSPHPLYRCCKFFLSPKLSWESTNVLCNRWMPPERK